MATDIRQAAEQFIDALHTLEHGSAEDADEVVAMFSSDAELVNAALKLAGKQENGTDGVKHFWTEYRKMFETMDSEFDQITVNDNAAGLFWTTKGTDNEGESFEYDGVSLLVFDDDGKITRFRGYYDTRQLERKVKADS